MAILIISPETNNDSWIRSFKRIDSNIDIRNYPNEGNPDDIELAFVRNHPKGILNKYKNLKCICSKGAGVDHIFKDPDLPHNVPITKIVDNDLTNSMKEYVLTMILNYKRHIHTYLKQNQSNDWKVYVPLQKKDLVIGVMGLGNLGDACATLLVDHNFEVRGWSRTEKNIINVSTFFGSNQLNTFLEGVNILVCLLPLTDDTKNILNKDLFSKLSKDSYVINVARGDHLVENDLIKFIDSGHLSGACLDVFREEPLPKPHKFWKHPKIIITPHISSLTNPKTAALQVYENYKYALDGKPFINVVDKILGY